MEYLTESFISEYNAVDFQVFVNIITKCSWLLKQSKLICKMRKTYTFIDLEWSMLLRLYKVFFASLLRLFRRQVLLVAKNFSLWLSIFFKE